MNQKDPVFLDCFRPSGMAALYKLVSVSSNQEKTTIRILSKADFNVPGQPVEFDKFLAPEYRASFEQISTSRLDPRFAAVGTTSVAAASNSVEDQHPLDVLPEAGTLVLFVSLSLL